MRCGGMEKLCSSPRSCVTGFGCDFKISQRLEPLCSITFSLLRILGWTPSIPRCEIPDRPQRQVPVCSK